MSVLYIVLPLALLLAGAFLLAFRWAARSGQLDDLETPAMRVLHEEPRRQARPERPAPPEGSSA